LDARNVLPNCLPSAADEARRTRGVIVKALQDSQESGNGTNGLLARRHSDIAFLAFLGDYHDQMQRTGSDYSSAKHRIKAVREMRTSSDLTASLFLSPFQQDFAEFDNPIAAYVYLFRFPLSF
jgi:hypothetical protein